MRSKIRFNTRKANTMHPSPDNEPLKSAQLSRMLEAMQTDRYKKSQNCHDDRLAEVR